MLDTAKMTATTGEAFSSLYLRVYVSTGAASVIAPPTVSIAGLYDEDIGVLPRVAASGDEVSIDLYGKSGTQMFHAAGAITGNAYFYRAASGKVSATPAGAPLGVAITPASGSGAIFEGRVFPKASGPVKVTDPGTAQAIPVPYADFDVMLTIGSAGAETNTLAIPKFVGQRARIFVDTVGTGTRAITVAAAINVTGNTIITFGEVRDYVELVGVTVGGSLMWQILTNVNGALS